MIKDPRILLLDEPTSALDAESESIVQKTIDKISVGRTTIVIAHKIATISSAHTIVVLDHGSVTEIGNHSQLMEKSGTYYNLIKLASKHISKTTPKEIVIQNDNDSSICEKSFPDSSSSRNEDFIYLENKKQKKKPRKFRLSEKWKLQKPEK